MKPEKLNKAKKLETFYGKYSNIVAYEYRGHKYEVEYANDLSYCVSPAWYQHKNEQEKIDDMIDNFKQPTETHPFDPDEIFNILGWN